MLTLRPVWVSQYQNVFILDFNGANDEVGGGINFTGAIRRAKLRSNHHQQTNTQHYPTYLQTYPSCQQREYWKKGNRQTEVKIQPLGRGSYEIYGVIMEICVPISKLSVGAAMG